MVAWLACRRCRRCRRVSYTNYIRGKTRHLPSQQLTGDKRLQRPKRLHPPMKLLDKNSRRLEIFMSAKRLKRLHAKVMHPLWKQQLRWGIATVFVFIMLLMKTAPFLQTLQTSDFQRLHVLSDHFATTPRTLDIGCAAHRISV